MTLHQLHRTPWRLVGAAATLARDQPAAGPPQRARGQHGAHREPPGADGRGGLPGRARRPLRGLPHTGPSGEPHRLTRPARADCGHVCPAARGRAPPARRPRLAAVLRRGQRRRHPAAGLDQRRRRADGAAVQRPRHQPVRVAGAAAARLRGAGDLLEPPRRGRLRAPGRPGPGRRAGLRRGRPRGARPRRRGRLPGAGLVDRGQHRLRARRAAPRAGDRPVRGRRRPRRHLLLDGGAAPDPAPGAAAAGARRRHRAGQDRRPDHPGDHAGCRSGPRRRTCCGTAGSCCRARTAASSSGRSGSS